MAPIGRRAALIACVVVVGCGDDVPAFPSPDPSETSPPGPAAFAGAESCQDCHENQYADWALSTHGRAGGAPSPGTVVAPFDGSPIRFSDALVWPRVQGDRWFFETSWLGESREMDVVAVVGRGHMRGGGTQGFTTEWPDGTVRFLPFDWSVAAGFWFCNTNGRTDEGWRPIDESMSLADCADWPPSRILGTNGRFQNCQGCHGSQIRVTRGDEGYHTEWTSLRVECEACHGPAQAHVDRALAAAEAGQGGIPTVDDPPGTLPDVGLPSLSTLPTEASLAVCDACHSLKGQLREGHVTGSGDLGRYYSLGMAWLDGQPYTADGRVASFAYQGTHRSSACYLDGAMSCTSCHEPHGQGYWDVNRKLLASPFDDGQCTACHAAKAADPEGHTLHPPSSAGARCVSCHMPYVQHPAVGEAVPFSRADHTVSIPRAASSRGRLRSACSTCHGDWTRDEIEREILSGWGPLKRPRPLVDALTRRSEALAQEPPGELFRADLYDPVARLTLMAHFAVEAIQPGVPAPPEVTRGLWAQADSRNPDVAAMALAILHLTEGHRAPQIQRLSEALEPLSESDPLRHRWVASLTYLGDRWREDGRTDDALAAYRAGLALLPEQVYLLQAVGVLLREDGGPWLERAVAAEPNRPLTKVALALFHQAAGSPDRALLVLEEALAQSPTEPITHHIYGRVLASTGDRDGARTALERAADLDWGSPDILRDLMTVQEALGDREAARRTARRLLAFSPGHAEATRILNAASQNE
ncbi:MAG: hypothetical protein HKN73_13255 [Gemmatimonadetes bacterium]|nr:hypothetical protein [Gemmatimonadota bacterium]